MMFLGMIQFLNLNSGRGLIIHNRNPINDTLRNAVLEKNIVRNKLSVVPTLNDDEYISALGISKVIANNNRGMLLGRSISKNELVIKSNTASKAIGHANITHTNKSSDIVI